MKQSQKEQSQQVGCSGAVDPTTISSSATTTPQSTLVAVESGSGGIISCSSGDNSCNNSVEVIGDLIPMSTTTTSLNIDGDDVISVGPDELQPQPQQLSSSVVIVGNCGGCDGGEVEKHLTKTKTTLKNLMEKGNRNTINRKVSFPQSDSELVTGYCEPTDPWDSSNYS